MTAKVERLVNLTVALLETRRPMSFAEIRRRTGYYAQDDQRAARRMFERDKDELRRLGVPIATQPLPFSEEVGYRVVRDDYELPDVALTAEEVAALALAVRLTGAQGTPLALAKLAARAPDPADPPRTVTRIELGKGLSEGLLDALADAILARVTVRFGYRTAAGTDGERTVDPYAVVRRRAASYLVGRDQGRGAVRAFRLDRMSSVPVPVGEPAGFEPPDDLDAAAAVRGPELADVAVELAVSPPARWAVELRGGRATDRCHGPDPVYVLEGLHPMRDLAWILGLGAQVTVLSPPELRQAVIDGLEAVLAAASDDVSDDRQHEGAVS